MKKSPSLFVWVLVVILTSCTDKQESGYTALTILVDVSSAEFHDPNFLDENLPKFFHLMKLDPETGGMAGGEIKLSLISGSGNDLSAKATLKKGRVGENRLIRNKEIEKFMIKCIGDFSELLPKGASWERDKSRIIEKASRELGDLNVAEADTKYLILFSDLIENSNYINLYDEHVDIQGLVADPETTIKNFSTKGPVFPEDLHNIGIIAITNRNDQNTELVTLAEELWGSLIRYRRGKIRFSSVLDI